MDCNHSNTNTETRKPGSHLTLDERGMIQALHRKGYSLLAISEAVGCAHSTVFYELKRGTPERKGNVGRMPQYIAKRGQQVYREHRLNSRCPCRIDKDECEPFIQWMAVQVRKEHWSIDRMCRSCQVAQVVPARKHPLHQDAVQYALNRETSAVAL